MTEVRIAPSHTFAVVEVHARDFVDRSASDCDMRQEEVTKTASRHCEVIRVSTHRWLKELRRTVAWKNHLLARQPCRPPFAIA